jgi:ubiquinone biosynthesis protein Coq4
MYKKISAVRAFILVWLTHQLALPLLKCIRKPQKFSYTKEDLSKMKEGTLGKDLVKMLDQNKLELLPYYIKHDLKHILLDYDTTGEGEVCLQCFMLGNGHISFPVAATVGFGLVTMPEYWGLFLKAFKRGRQSASLQHWQWHSLLELSTQSLKEKINGHVV